MQLFKKCCYKFPETICSLAEASKLVLHFFDIYDHNKYIPESKDASKICIASEALQRIHAAGSSWLQPSRPGLNTSVGKAISAGYYWIVSILSPNQSDLPHCNFKENTSSLSIWFFISVYNRNKTSKVGLLLCLTWT